jgi:hypothetical protein
MEKRYQISLHIKTPTGFETFGTFELGNDREQALSIYSQLQGTPDIGPASVLYMDISEISDGIPLPVAVMHCTLEELAYNTKIITREVFKYLAI